jgi:hypothetical protein
MDNNETIVCSTDGVCEKKKCCSIRSFLLPLVGVFAIIFVFDWIFHGILMMPAYEATASLWRSKADMQSLCYINLIREIVTAAVVTCLFLWLQGNVSVTGKKCCPIGMGAKFGLKIGLLIGITQFGSYFYLPMPLEIALYWLAGNVVLGVFIGIALGFMSTCKKDKTAQ